MSNPRWRGINHLALITPDMDATVRFYHGALGMPIVATINAGPMRHYFFDMGMGNTIAFFCWSDAEVDTFEKPAGIPPDFPAQFDHVSFNLPELRDLIDLQARLREHGVEVTELVDHGFVQSVYFTDPNGIALEASYWVTEPTGRPGRLRRRRDVPRHRPRPRRPRAHGDRRAGLHPVDPPGRRGRRPRLIPRFWLHPAASGRGDAQPERWVSATTGGRWGG